MPQAAGIIDEKLRPMAVNRQGRRCEGLKLDRVCAVFGCRTQDSLRGFQTTVMIRGHFRNYQRPVPWADWFSADLDV